MKRQQTIEVNSLINYLEILPVRLGWVRLLYVQTHGAIMPTRAQLRPLPAGIVCGFYRKLLLLLLSLPLLPMYHYSARESE